MSLSDEQLQLEFINLLIPRPLTQAQNDYTISLQLQGLYE